MFAKQIRARIFVEDCRTHLILVKKYIFYIYLIKILYGFKIFPAVLAVFRSNIFMEIFT